MSDDEKACRAVNVYAAWVFAVWAILIVFLVVGYHIVFVLESTRDMPLVAALFCTFKAVQVPASLARVRAHRLLYGKDPPPL
jgi:NAD/NADP transhydrogenase beta subunit